MIGILLIVTGLLLRQFLNKPMSRFIDMVNSYAAGNSNAFKKGTSYTEFLALVNVLDGHSHYPFSFFPWRGERCRTNYQRTYVASSCH